MKLLRQGTSQLIRFGPFLDNVDGDTEETALAITQADMLISKDGAAYAQVNSGSSATHDTKGNYSILLNAIDTDTVGILKFYVHVPGALAVWEDFMVVTAASYDEFVVNGANNISVNDILTTQLTESYAADGVAPTLEQAILLLQQLLGEFSITGTDITVKQLDSSTTAATYTLDNATVPTSKTRTS